MVETAPAFPSDHPQAMSSSAPLAAQQNNQYRRKKLIIIIIIACIAVVLGLVVILFISLKTQKTGGGEETFPFNVKKPPEKGCGNAACEADETFDSCPSDCNLPSSIEPFMVATSLSTADLPPPPKDTQWPTPRDTHWSKFLDNYTITVEGGYLPPALNNFELLYGKQTAIRLAEYGDSLELALDSMARIDQYVLVYSPDDIEKVFAATTKSIFAPASAGLVSKDLPDPGIGDKSKAFAISFSDNKQRYFVVFIKKAYFEMVVLSGTVYEYKVLEDIARKAAEKIQ